MILCNICRPGCV